MSTKVGFKQCVVCGAEYKLGPNCKRLAGAGAISWRYTTDTHQCYKVFCVIKDYADGAISIGKAHEDLADLLVGVDYSGYNESAKPLIDEIMAYKPEHKTFKTKSLK